MSHSTLDLSIAPRAVAATLPKVTGARPLGSSILVELLTKEEMNSLVSSVLHLGGADAGPGTAQQGYVVAVGPNLGEGVLSVGARVIVTNSHGQGFVPVPNVEGGKRVRGVVELHNIKAVLDEESAIVTA